MPITTTWGWATWSRVWDEIDFKCSDYNPKSLNKYKFNFSNSYNFARLLDMQLNGHKVSSWGIRFYFNVFNKNGIVLYPDKTLVKNIGWDNSGRHGANFQLHSSSTWANDYKIEVFPFPKLNHIFTKLNVRYLKWENSAFVKIFKKFFIIIKI